MQTRVWLSYDIGIRGDLEGIFQFLGRHKATECGGNSASFVFNHTSDLISEIQKEIKKDVSLDKRTRIYLIHKSGEKYIGKFIFGTRRTAPWASFIPAEGDEEDSGE
jgi:hypothetical protein